MSEAYDRIKAEIASIGEKIDRASDGYKRGEKIINSSLPFAGLTVPQIKALAKSVALSSRDEFMDGFFNDADKTYESVAVAGLVASKKGDYSKTAEYLKKIIPLFSSWAHTDTIVPQLRFTDRETFLSDFRYLLEADGQYEVRTYLIYLLSCCLNEEYFDIIVDTLKSVRYGRYYVDMGAAWLLSVMLVKFYDKTLPFFEKVTFPPFVHNKAIQKARESFRVPQDRKDYLNSLKV
ncbi:MAG: DNA alkylation repair protein [Clostridiales bacterium]|nr:DNA alkylation repair protein [Clostridiales bacterium]